MILRYAAEMTVPKPVIAELHAAMHECLDLILEHASRIPPGLLVKELPGFGHPTIPGQISHVLATEASWVHALQLLPFQPFNPKSLDDLRWVKKDVMSATLAYLDSLDERRLNAELDRYTERWVGPRRSPAFILLHVITHAFHHKGQIASMLRLLGYPAPDTDMQRA
jgi:uncharacterized damage-inducible protein DinB